MRSTALARPSRKRREPRPAGTVAASKAARVAADPARARGAGARRAAARAARRRWSLTANPGITIPEIAEKMGIKQNYLYRVLPGLAEDGLVDEGRSRLASEDRRLIASATA